MTEDAVRRLLSEVAAGRTGAEEAYQQLREATGALPFAHLDHHREQRTGCPEVIYGEGKTPEQAALIFERMAAVSPVVLCTRSSEAMAQAILAKTPQAVYHVTSRVVELRREGGAGKGCVVVACAGTSDLAVAEEAAVVCAALGNHVERLYDVGVAGIHRLLHRRDLLERATCVIAVAGMEGALPSVIGGVVHAPIVAVPTSVGYGAGFGGIAALLAMLNSCAPGIGVVNIDNGFGAAVLAHKINQAASGETP